MTEIGTIALREFSETKRRNGIKRNRCIYVACEECGKPRWILLWAWKRGLFKYCQLCSLKHMNFNSRSTHWGKDNNHWKGGRKITKDGYVSILIRPDDPYFPMASNRREHGGYILEHRLNMALRLGRLLQKFELVHHIDGDRSNNDISNLQLTTAAKHNLSYRDGFIAGKKSKQWEQYPEKPHQAVKVSV